MNVLTKNEIWRTAFKAIPPQEEARGELKIVLENGFMYNLQTFESIRNHLQGEFNNSLKG